MLGYETVTTIWSPRKIHNELGICHINRPFSLLFLALLQWRLTALRKEARRENQKVSPKEKIVPKGKSKGKNDAGKGKGHW